jgi:hypothetical protein
MATPKRTSKRTTSGTVQSKVQLTLDPIRSGRQYFAWGLGNDDYTWAALIAVRDCTPAQIAINERTRYIIGEPWENEAAANLIVASQIKKLTLNELYQHLCNQAAWWDGAFCIRVKRDITGRPAEYLPAPLQNYRRNREDSGWLFNPWFGDKLNYQQTQSYAYLPDFDPLLTPAQGVELMDAIKVANGGDYWGELIYCNKRGEFDHIYPYPAWANSIEVLQRSSLTAKSLKKQALGEFMPKVVMTVVGTFDDYNGNRVGPGDTENVGPSQLQVIQGQLGQMLSPDDPTPAMVFTAPNKESMPQVDVIQTEGLAVAAADIQAGADDMVLRNFSVPPILCGQAKSGQLGNMQELANNERLFNQRCKAWRIPIIDKLQELFNVTITVRDVVGFSYIDPAYLDVLTPDEKRKQIGYEALPAQSDNAAKGLVDVINGLSPLVANKILDSMSPQQILDIVGLQYQPATPPPLPNATT